MKTHLFLYRIFLLLIVLIPNTLLRAQGNNQQPLYDALKYTNAVNANEQQNDATQMQQAKMILDKYSGLDSTLRTLITKYNKVNTQSNTDFSLDGSMHTMDGTNLGAPAMIDELAKLVAERFREELTMAFLDRFRAKLKHEPHLAEIFPNTRRVLLYDDPFNYDAWLTSFRGALHMDLSAIPQHIPELLEGILAKSDTGKLNSVDSTTYANTISDLSHLLDFVNHPEKSYTNSLALAQHISTGKIHHISEPKAKSAFQWIHLLMGELGSSDKQNWARSEDLKALIDNPDAYKCFLAFFLHKHAAELRGIQVGNSNVYALLSDGKSNSKPDMMLQQIMKNVQGIATQITQIKRDTDKENAFQNYLKLSEKSLSLFNELFTDTTTFNRNVANIWTELNYSLGIVGQIQEDLADKNYAEILPGILAIIDTILPQHVLENSLFLKEVLKYANLAVSLSTAQTSEEFASALEGAVLPAQSYRLKRNSLFSISANAYAGGFLAMEFLQDPAAKSLNSGIAGFTAPIGVAFNLGLTRKSPTKFSQTPVRTKALGSGNTISGTKNFRYYSGHSLSLFASVIDIGAVAAFRLKDQTTPTAQVQWRNIIAPGAYLIWGIGNSPISLNVGAQYGPELRKVVVTNGEAISEIDSRAWRFGAAITVDIPLMNFYCRTERIQQKLR